MGKGIASSIFFHCIPFKMILIQKKNIHDANWATQVHVNIHILFSGAAYNFISNGLVNYPTKNMELT